MRLPLIVAATSAGDYPPIRLASGKWKFEKTDGSSVTIKLPLSECDSSSVVEITEHTIISATLNEKPTKSFWLYACLIP